MWMLMRTIGRLSCSLGSNITTISGQMVRTPLRLSAANFTTARSDDDDEASSQLTVTPKQSADYSFNDPDAFLEIYPKITKGGELSKSFIVHDLLMKRLGFDQQTAQHLHDNHHQLKEIHAETFLEIVRLYKEQGIGNETLLNNFELLFDSLGDVKKKFKLMTRVGVNSETIILMKFDLPVLQKMTSKWFINESVVGRRYSNRLQYVKDTVGCDLQSLIKYPKTLTMTFSGLKKRIKLLFDHGIKREDLSGSINILQFGFDRIEYRVRKAWFSNIGPLRCWLISCRSDIFEQTILKWRDMGYDLPADTELESYLLLRLECSKEYLHYLNCRCSRILNLEIQDVKLVLDFVYSLGFTPNHVCLTPTILRVDFARLQQRYAEFTQLGFKPNHLYQLMANEKDFKDICSRISTQFKVTSQL